VGFAGLYRSFTQGRVTPVPVENIMPDQARPSGSISESNSVSTASTVQGSLRAELLKMILRKEAERRAAYKPNFEINSRPRAEWRYGA